MQTIYFRPELAPELRKTFGNTFPASLKPKASGLMAGTVVIEKPQQAIGNIMALGSRGTGRKPVRLLFLPENAESGPTHGSIYLALLGLGVRAYPLPDTGALRRIVGTRGTADAEKRIAFAKVEGGQLMVWDCNLNLHSCPVTDFPVLAKLDENALQRFQISASGSRMHWDDGDIDLGLESVRYFSDPEFRKKVDGKTAKEFGRYGNAIRKLRVKKGLKQTDFLPEINDREIRRIENGEVNARYDSLCVMAEKHGMTVRDYLAALAGIQ